MSRETRQASKQELRKKKTKKQKQRGQQVEEPRQDEDEGANNGEERERGQGRPHKELEVEVNSYYQFNDATKTTDKNAVPLPVTGKKRVKKKAVSTTGDESIDRLLYDVNELVKDDEGGVRIDKSFDDADPFRYISTRVYSHTEPETFVEPALELVTKIPATEGRKAMVSGNKKKDGASSIRQVDVPPVNGKPDEIVSDGGFLSHQVLAHQAEHPAASVAIQDDKNADKHFKRRSKKHLQAHGLHLGDDEGGPLVPSRETTKKKKPDNDIAGHKIASLVQEEVNKNNIQADTGLVPKQKFKKNKRSTIADTPKSNLAQQILTRQKEGPRRSKSNPSLGDAKDISRDKDPADGNDFLNSLEMATRKNSKRKSNKKNDNSEVVAPLAHSPSFLRGLEIQNQARKFSAKPTTTGKDQEAIKKKSAKKKVTLLDVDSLLNNDDMGDFRLDDSVWVDVVPTRKKAKRKKLTTEMKDKVMKRVATKKKKKVKKQGVASTFGMEETEVNDVLGMKDFEIKEIPRVGWFGFDGIRTDKGLDRDDNDKNKTQKKRKSEKRFKSRANYLYQYSWWTSLEEMSTTPAYFMATIGFKKRCFNVSNLFTDRPFVPNPYKFDPKVLQKVHDPDDPWDLIKWLMLKYNLMAEDDNDDDDIGMEILGIWHGANAIDGDDDDSISIPSAVESVHFSDEEDTEIEEYFNGKRREQVEVTPGNFAVIRSEAETYEALDMGEVIESLCLGCGIALVCVRDALQVSCPMCRSVTPLNGISLHRPFGIATGITRASCRDQLPTDDDRTPGNVVRNDSASGGTRKVATACRQQGGPAQQRYDERCNTRTFPVELRHVPSKEASHR